MACMGCKGLGPSNTYYCSKEHQTLDWKTREGSGITPARVLGVDAGPGSGEGAR